MFIDSTLDCSATRHREPGPVQSPARQTAQQTARHAPTRRQQESDPARSARLLRRTPSDRLRAALCALAQGEGKLVSRAEHPWASITFAGSRHVFEFVFDGAQAVEAAEQLIAALPEHEFAIPHHLVAEATIGAVSHTLVPHPRLSLTCHILLLEEA